MFIKHIRVKNFMVHKDTSIDLHPITVLVGPNNSGKSAFFDALINFSMVSRGKISTAFSPGPYSYEALRTHGTSPATRISYAATLTESAASVDSIEYELSYGHNRNGYIIHDEKITSSDGTVLFDRSDPDHHPLGGATNFINDETSIFAAIRQAQLRDKYVETSALLTAVAREISRISKYRLDPSNLGRASRLPETAPTSHVVEPRISYQGDDLATVLYQLSDSGSDQYAAIEAACHRVIDGFDHFDFNLVGIDRIGFSVVFADSRDTVAAANLSDGTLSSIGLVTLLADPNRAAILCIEEPENGLTPLSIRAVYEMMKKYSAEQDELGSSGQLLVASHSPYVICEAWNGDDREFIYQVKSDHGTAEIRRYSDVIAGHEIMLEKDQSGKRSRLNLRSAELVMDGYWS